jgi:hypothetical protein
VDALQTAGKYEVATSLNWKLGDESSFYTGNKRSSKKHLQEGSECVDWFLRRKNFTSSLGFQVVE